MEEKVEELFASVEVAKLEVPFTLESARSSFLKTIEKLPPSEKSQEFKDGVLWADCMTLLSSDSVKLVTSDKAFYQDRAYEKGLAQNLQVEANDRPNELQILPSLSELLTTIRTLVILHEDSLAEAFLEQHHESVFKTLARHGFDLGERLSLPYTLYATENPNVLFLEFSMIYQCTDAGEEGRTDVVLRLKGDGSYNPTTAQFTLRNFGEHLSYRMPDGTEQENRNHVLAIGGIVLGHKEITNTIRYKLD